MAAQNELSALILKTVEEQTFSLDAVKAIGAIRDRAIALESALAASERTVAEQRLQIAERTEAVNAHLRRQTELIERDKVVAAREMKITDLEKNAAVAQAQFSTLNAVFSTIFANRVVRENTLSSMPVATQQHGGGSFVTNYETRNTIDRTES